MTIIYLLLFAVLLQILVLKVFIPNSRKKIFRDAKQYFNATTNFDGLPVIQLDNYKILIDYDYENRLISYYEYIIGLIELTGLNNNQLNKLKKEFDIIKRRDKYYARVICSWGYHGEKFKERMLDKITQINLVLNRDNSSSINLP